MGGVGGGDAQRQEEEAASVMYVSRGERESAFLSAVLTSCRSR